MSKKKVRYHRVGRSALSLIALFLLCSGVIRVGVNSGQAWAKASEAFSKIDAPKEAPEPHDVVQQEVCKTDEDLQAVFEVLQNREKRLNEKDAKITERMAMLANAERDISVKLEELKAVEAELSRTLAIADQAAEKDIGKLVAVYEAMKPKDAALLFEEMEPSFAAGFLARMQPELAAGVMAGLSPTAAYTISAVLAGRNAEAPTQ